MESPPRGRDSTESFTRTVSLHNNQVWCYRPHFTDGEIKV